MDKKKLLIVEDDPSTVNGIISRLLEYDCCKITRLDELKIQNLPSYDLLLLDREIKGGDAWDWLDTQITTPKQKLPHIILMSGQTDIERFSHYKEKLQSVDNVPKDPPSDFYDRLTNAVRKILCPQSFDSIRTKLSKQYDGIYPESQKFQRASIIGIDNSMKQVRDRIDTFAKKNIPILITGETGTGKELVAKALHETSGRNGHFVAINLSALSEHIIESELFGHVKGAFTGATRDRKGKIEEADRGTLFLDEIAEIPHNIQVKLLRFLENKEYEKIGSNQTKQADVRIVTATNKNLREEVQNNRFREDLYFRLACSEIKLPPLRKRSPKDFDLLFEYFLRQYEKENELKEKTYQIDQKVYDKLREYPWPGNIRELKWTISQILATASSPKDNDRVTEEHLPEHVINPVCQEKIQDEVNYLLQKVAQKLPMDTQYDRIEQIQEDVAVFFFRRLYENSNKNWKEMARKCGRTDDSFCRPDKMNEHIKRIYQRVTQTKNDENQ